MELKGTLSAGRGAYDEVKDRPNVLCLVHTYQDSPVGNRGGTTMHVYDLVRHLGGRYNFHVLYYSGQEEGCFLLSYFHGRKVLNFLGRFPRNADLRLYDGPFCSMVSSLVGFLAIDLIHVHHLMDLYLDVFDVAKERRIPVVYTLHDYYAVCPSFTLMDAWGRPCNLLPERDCAACCRLQFQWDEGRIAEWREAFHDCLRQARKIVAPSVAAKDICRMFYDDLEVTVVEHGYDAPSAERRQDEGRKKNDGRFHVAFIGGISETKGLSYLKGMVREVSGTDVVIHLFGIADDALYNVSSRNYVYHGEYKREELPGLLDRYQIRLVCLLSVWAETFSYTLSESLLAGIPVMTLDIGAVAERVRRWDAGWVFPYGSSVHDLLEEIRKIRLNPEKYERKASHARSFAERSKRVEEMAAEYGRMYDGLMQDYPVIHKDEEDRGAWDVFRQGVRADRPTGESMSSVEQEYVRLKNMVFKGDAPLKEVFKEVALFREAAKGTKWRNKIVGKLVWYRFIRHYFMRLSAPFLRK